MMNPAVRVTHLLLLFAMSMVWLVDSVRGQDSDYVGDIIRRFTHPISAQQFFHLMDLNRDAERQEHDHLVQLQRSGLLDSSTKGTLGRAPTATAPYHQGEYESALLWEQGPAPRDQSSSSSSSSHLNASHLLSATDYGRIHGRRAFLDHERPLNVDVHTGPWVSVGSEERPVLNRQWEHERERFKYIDDHGGSDVRLSTRRMGDNFPQVESMRIRMPYPRDLSPGPSPEARRFLANIPPYGAQSYHQPHRFYGEPRSFMAYNPRPINPRPNNQARFFQGGY